VFVHGGCPAVCSCWCPLGHHDPTVTLRVYGHLQKDTDERARSVIDARMNRRRNVAGARLRLVRPDERPPLA
jgi:hypothetical protein